MKYKIEKITISLPPWWYHTSATRYIVSYKRHWWSGWRYVLNPRTKVPEQFMSASSAKAALDNL